jgi:hypothetical protein
VTVISLRYRFRQSFRVTAGDAYAWCTDFGPGDGPLFSERTRRSVRRLGEDALILTDTTYRHGRPLRIRRLVRLHPTEMAWTNTHLDGPYRNSQYWYRIVPDGARRSHLEFHGLRLEAALHRLSALQKARRVEECRRSDSAEWRRRLAPALEREMGRQTRGSRTYRTVPPVNAGLHR